MQPLVENAIIHGLERKIGIGVVSVRLTLTEKRLIVRISDNGVGMEPGNTSPASERAVPNSL